MLAPRQEHEREEVLAVRSLGGGGGGGTRGGRHVGVPAAALGIAALGRAAAAGCAARAWRARLVAPAHGRRASILRLLQRAAAPGLAAFSLAALGTRG